MKGQEVDSRQGILDFLYHYYHAPRKLQSFQKPEFFLCGIRSSNMKLIQCPGKDCTETLFLESATAA